MPITLITGPANAGKAELVMQEVRRQLAHGRDPWLVVPTRADVDHYARELAGDGAALGVRVERFAQLIARMRERAGARSRMLGPLARERVLQALAKRNDLPTSAGFVRALGELVGELQVRRVSAERLGGAIAELIATDGPAVAPAAIARLYGDYRAALRRLDMLDEDQSAARTLDLLRRTPSAWGATPVAIYGFDDLTRLQLDTIETLGRVVDADVTVSLAYEPGRAAFAGRAASFHALEPLAAQHRALPARADHYSPSARTALAHLERSLFEPQARRVPAGAAVTLMDGGGERAELELVAGEIAKAIAQGTPADEIAVLIRAPGVQLDLLEEVFAQAAIPFVLARATRFVDTATGAALIGALRCVPAPDGTCAGQLGDLLAWLRAPGLLERPELADALELAARRAGAASAAAARALWEQRHWPLDVLDRIAEAQARGASDLCERAARELQRLFAAPRLGSAALLDADERVEAGALATGGRALSALVELARAPDELAPATAGELASWLESLETLSGASAAPGCVAVLDPLALRARRVRVLFACGLQEGVFPARWRSQPLLGEDERWRLAEVTGLRLGDTGDLLASERYLFYAALSRPQERLFLSWHDADDDGEVTPRSLFVDDVCDLFGDDLHDRRLYRSLGEVDEGSAVGMSPIRAEGDRWLRDELPLAALRGRVWSPSSLERWIGCPTAWFVQRVLRPGALDPDAEPLAKGALAHAALKDTLEGLRAQTGSARLTPATLALARELLDRALVDNEAAHPLSVERQRASAARRRLSADLHRYLAHAAASPSPLEPTALELGFGFAPDDERGEGDSLPAVELDGGLRLQGRVDRVDRSDHGEAVVYDYKASRAPAGARWLSDGSLQVALYMLTVERLLDTPVVGGFYQPLSGEDLRARGVLDADAEFELDGVGRDVFEHDALGELLDHAQAQAREAAQQAGRGELAARPSTCAFRGGCMYPTICRCER